MTHTRDEIMAMNAEELRREIAKMLGWGYGERHSIPETNPPGRGIYNYLFSPGEEIEDEYWTSKLYDLWPSSWDKLHGWKLPNWPEDIGAMYSLEETIPEDEHLEYMEILSDVIRWQRLANNKRVSASLYRIAHATAEQRARAWLIWKEGQK